MIEVIIDVRYVGLVFYSEQLIAKMLITFRKFFCLVVTRSCCSVASTRAVRQCVASRKQSIYLHCFTLSQCRKYKGS